MGFQVVEAATVVCLRRARMAQTAHIVPMEFAWDNDGYALRTVFEKHNGSIEFKSGWQVLMGQGEVKNWLNSTPDKPVMMRYAGEFKFAGGTREDGELLEQAAVRELEEEFAIKVDLKTVRLRLFNIKQTKPVRNRSYLMHNFVALADENEWLRDLDVEIVNARLEERRRTHVRLMDSGEFWKLSKEDKCKVAPEVHACAWLDIRDAVHMCMTSNCAAFVPCNEWQREQFELYNIYSRDPMYQTMSTLLELEKYPSNDKLVAHCKTVTVGDQQELVKQQYINHREVFERAQAEEELEP